MSWSLTFSQQAALVFVCAFCVDVVWIFYMAAARLRRPVRAALWAGVMLGLGGINAYVFTHDIVMLGFTVLGAMAGTFFALKLPQ